MSEDQKKEVQKMIDDALAQYFTNQKFILGQDMQILDTRNIQIGRGTGTKIGTATDQKIGFFGAVPVDKPETVSDPSGGGSGVTDAIDISARSKIGDLIDRLQELGIIK